jgi:predicted amidohydrolase YtcJ
VVNATGNLDEIRAYAALRDRGELTVRTRTSFGTVAVNHQLSQQFLAQLEEARTLQDDEWVGANLVKFFADGAGGPPLYQPDDFQALVLELDRRGYQIMTHSLTAATTSTVLDAYEYAIKTNGPRDRRFRIEHASNVPIDEIPRFAALGITASMQAEFCCNDQPGLSNAWQSLRKAGVNLVFGSDWPCTFPPDPFTAIQQSLERTVRPVFAPYTPFPNKVAGSPQESLSVVQAVDAYTRGGAYAAYIDEDVGTLEPGKLADLAVLTQDIFNVPAAAIGNTQVLLTMVGGRIVFDQMKIRH